MLGAHNVHKSRRFERWARRCYSRSFCRRDSDTSWKNYYDPVYVRIYTEIMVSWLPIEVSRANRSSSLCKKTILCNWSYRNGFWIRNSNLMKRLKSNGRIILCPLIISSFLIISTPFLPWRKCAYLGKRRISEKQIALHFPKWALFPQISTFLIISTPFLASRKCAYYEWVQYFI